MHYAEYYLAVNEWDSREALPPEWGEWPEAWPFYKQLNLRNPIDTPRTNEPVEVDVEFYADQVSDLAREVRVVEVASDSGPLREVPSQVHSVFAEDEAHYCRLFFLADLGPQQRKTYLIFYGNPDCAPPTYETDLEICGEAYALDIENSYYRVELARSMGQLKSLFFKQGTASYVGHGPPMSGGHGVESTIHWNPDWSDAHAGRYRVTNWPKPPHYEVVRGPVCLRLRRWGHPILALGPAVGQPHKVVATITYTFYASTPYFLMESRLEAVEEVEFLDCRNDEWVGGMEPCLPEAAWMTREGEIGFGSKSWRQNPAWMSFYNRETGDGFATLGLDYECTHPSWPEPANVAISNPYWDRCPLLNTLMRRGDFISERNAYLVHRYEPPREHGFGMLMDYYRILSSPLVQEEPPLATRPLTVANVLDALRSCYDTEVYTRSRLRPRDTRRKRLSVVDLGLVRRVDIAGDRVRIALVLPYEGRQTWFGYYASTMEEQILQRIAGVAAVEVEQVREPSWRPEQMKLKAQRWLGLLASGAER